jgi:hypothetical protein
VSHDVALKSDLIERHNLIADPAQAGRVKLMERAYCEIRATQLAR